MKISTRKKSILIRILILLLLFIAITVVIDLMRISTYEIYPMRPSSNLKSQHDQIYYELVNGAKEIDWERLSGTLEYIKGEYDCSDFRLVNLLRIIYDYGDRIPENYMSKIEDVLFNFRYWWDEPGENSMCYWSENHQILFASAEYLVGQKYPDITFPSSGLTGKDHISKARKRILDWLEMRWNYGFIEFNSGVYYNEDIGAMINIIDYVKDNELVIKTQMIMDLLFYDVAVQNINHMFVSTSGRAYKGNRVGGPGQTLGNLTHLYWGSGIQRGPGMTYAMSITEKYELPPVIRAIALDSSNVIIKQSNGLNINELKSEGYYGTDNRSMMMQWGMECFTNPEIVRNSLHHIRNCNMFTNEFVEGFKALDFTLFRWLRLEPLIIKWINPQSNGVAIQKGNTYTYKTKDYTMYTAQSYHPETYGDQQHIFGMNMGNHFSIFHNHPAIEKNVDNQSPNYWVGYGHIPHVVQDKNVSIAIYNIPVKKGMMEMDLLNYTRAYFPRNKFDSTIVDGNYAFGKKGETYCALVGTNEFSFRDTANDDVIQIGKQTFWITEAGSKTTDGSFEDFTQRIRMNKIEFDEENLELVYYSGQNKYRLIFKGEFEVNDTLVKTNYDRYDSPYVKAKKKDRTITFNYNGKTLHLDFDNMIRKMN